MRTVKIRAYDKVNNQVLKITCIAFERSLHNYIKEAAIIGVDEQDNYFELNLEHVDIEMRINDIWERVNLISTDKAKGDQGLRVVGKIDHKFD